MTESTNENEQVELRRSLGIFDAIMMGLGSIVGTGVFVSIAIAAGVAGANVIFCIFLAALVALCNAMSSAQLAAASPVSGGCYEYGYRYLHPWAGFIAGWLFLAAKSCSAATAALGFSGYIINLFGLNEMLLIPIAIAACLTLTIILKKGIKKSSLVNIIIVAITFAALIIYLTQMSSCAFNNGKSYLNFYLPSNFGSIRHFLSATALIFVAFTGYGRIATLGEEVSEPRLTIPIAIISTLAITTILYIAIAIVTIGSVGSEFLTETFSSAAAPLEIAARSMGQSTTAVIIAIGAITAMLGVLLNLILGLSRVLLAMSRRNDMPEELAEINPKTSSPEKAVLIVGFIIAGLTIIGNVKLTWSFSAFTVLIYYSITNLAALRMPRHLRIYPRAYSWAGLIGCLSLAFWIDPMVWFSGIILIAIGFIWKLLMPSANQ